MAQTIFRILITLLAIASVATVRAEGRRQRTKIGDTPWTMKTASERPSVVYGEDDRIDHYEETDADRLAWAAATCGLMPPDEVQDNRDGTYSLNTYTYEVCQEEPFSGQPTAAVCTGFMVGPDLIATAGHCFKDGELRGTRFVFGFVMEDPTTPQLTLQANQVYTGVELVGHALSDELDYAIVRVDRSITAPGAKPFALRQTGVAPVGASIGVIGHPSGLPLKLAFGTRTIVRDNSAPHFFTANVDSYGGNSGSPVIDPKTGIVEGILVRGDMDFVDADGCRRSNTESDTGGRGEDVTRSASFARYVVESSDTDKPRATGYPFASYRW